MDANQMYIQIENCKGGAHEYLYVQGSKAITNS